MGAFVTSRPPIWMVPLSSGTSPEIARNVVVLPTALGPNNKCVVRTEDDAQNQNERQNDNPHLAYPTTFMCSNMSIGS